VPTAYLLTEHYPYPGGDDAFLPVEVDEIRKHMDLVVIPLRTAHTAPREVPQGVLLDVSLATEFAETLPFLTAVVWSLCRLDWIQEFCRQWPASGSPRGAITILVRCARARMVQRWLERRLRSGQGPQPSVIYSWWSSFVALGASKAVENREICMVSRAHGYDLFAEQERVGFVPFQEKYLSLATAVFSVSEAGRRYLVDLYPQYRHMIHVAYLGTLSAGEVESIRAPQVRSIVTCSSVVGVKRLDRLVDALEVLAHDWPQIEFHWIHIGGGVGLPDLVRKCATRDSLVGRTTFLGQVTPERVREFLSGTSVDAFCNVSSSEGLPVTLMEAASAGIPLLALDVGGNSEVVDASNGRLLPADATAGQIASALASILTAAPDEVASMRQASRRRWQERFDGRRNYVDFARRLVELAQVPTGRGQ